MMGESRSAGCDGMFGAVVPSRYVGGYEAARKVDRELADLYVRYTVIGDPSGDEVVAELAERYTPGEIHGIVAKALDSPGNAPKDLPACIRSFVAELADAPEWFDERLAAAATRGFLRNSDMVLGALVGGAIIEGFSTMISKSFRIRSRIVENGVRRLKQNLAQLLDQYMPGGILPGGDGWRLSIRIRLIHAQARRLIRQTEEWDESEYGLPLSAAHMLLGAAAFSGRLMQHVGNLGGDFSAEEREGYVHVWRYAGSLMGVPEEIMFRDFASSAHTFEIGAMCEPGPDEDSMIMANSIVNSAPIVLGITETGARRSMAAYMYQVSRELIGNDLADDLRYPPSRLIRELPFLRLRNFGDQMLRRAAPRLAARRSRTKFSQMFAVADLGQFEHSFSLPTSVFDEESREW